MKDLFSPYIHSRLRSVRLQLAAYNKRPAAERLHRIRVDIKKIRSLLAFGHQFKKPKTVVDMLRPLFRDVGEIRDRQIQREVLEDFKHRPKKTLARLRAAEKKAILRLKKNASVHYANLRKFYEGIDPSEFVLTKKSVRRCFKKEFRKICSEVFSGDRESLHQFRKGIKRLHYVYEFLPGKYRRAVKIPVSLLKDLQQKAGDWHDVYATLQFLLEQKTDKEIRSAAKVLKNKEKKLALNLFRKIKKVCSLG